MSKGRQRPFVIITGDFVRTGGQDYANFALADYLAREGRELDLVAYRADPSLLARPNVHLHRVPKIARSYILSSPLLRSAGLAEHAIRRGITVANGGSCPAPSMNWVHYVHAAYRARSSVRAQRMRQTITHPLNLLNEKVALSVARVVITNSERTKRDVVERVRIREDKVHTVYYGIDASRFRPSTIDEKRAAAASLGWPADRFRAVFIGALGDRRKGFDRLFEAWSELCREASWDGELVVVGSGGELDAWRRRAEDEAMAERIRFLGFRSDVPAILASSDTLISPTRYEAYGLGVHEAICSGIPAIVSASAGVAERYPDALRSLLIGDPEDSSSIASAIRSVHDDHASVRSAIAQFSETLRARSWDDMARDIEKLSERV